MASEKRQLALRWMIVFTLFVVCLGGSESTPDAQRNIAFLELLSFCVAYFVADSCLPQARAFWWWLVSVLLLMSFCNVLVIVDNVEGGAWTRVIELGAHFFFAAAVFAWFKEDRSALKIMGASLAVFVGLYAAFVSFVWWDFANPRGNDWFFNPPLFSHIRHVGYFVCAAAVILAWQVLTGERRRLGFAWVGYVLALSILLWSGGRGAIVSVSIGVGILLLVIPNRRRWIDLLVGCLLALAISASFPVDQPGLGWLSALLRTDSAGSLDELGTGRVRVWSYLWEYILQRPWFGWGGEGFRAVWVGFPIVQAHNGVLQLLIEWGVVGLLLIGLPLIVLLGRTMLEFRKLEGNRDAVALGLALVISLLTFSMVDGIFYYGLPLVFISIGYVLLIMRPSPEHN